MEEPESVRSEIATRINVKGMAWIFASRVKQHSRNSQILGSSTEPHIKGLALKKCVNLPINL